MVPHRPGISVVAPEVEILVPEHDPWNEVTPTLMTFAFYLSSNDSDTNNSNR